MTARVALVTGGAGGIGSAIGRKLADAGHLVAAADLPATGAPFPLDVTDPASVEACVAAVTAELGLIGICVNCAGWDKLMPFLETDEDFLQTVLEINLAGPMRVTRAALPSMVEAGWGRVVNVASDAGRVGSSLEAIYSGAKGGLIAFSKTIAREMARHGITANAVCPGPTDTPLLNAVVADRPDADKVIAAMSRGVPMGRLGQPDDVAVAVAFLASEDAGYITGQTLSVSGGLTMV